MKSAAKIFAILMLLSFGTVAFAQDALRLEEDVRFLSDSLRQGRVTGSRGLTDAAFYVARQFKACGLQVSFNSFRCSGSVGHDVQGFMMRPGASRYIIVMAHMDGAGTVSPGADSNASGVAAMLELARNRNFGKLSHNIIYVALDGHYDGLAGANAFWEDLAARGIGPRQIAMVINLDILGSDLFPPQKGWRQYVIALGGARYENSLQGCNSGLELRMYFDYYDSRSFTDIFYRKSSDHRIFLEHSVPCVMFTSGITMNTNKASDRPETLNYPLLARRVQLIGRWMEKL